MKIAVIGAGISGLSCAYRLATAGLDVVLFEAGAYFGGHSNTVDVSLDGVTHGVDTGFLVFNDACYPNLVELFGQLKIDVADSDMSFSVKLPLGSGVLEWAGASLGTVFAQRRNLLRPAFLGMLRDILRFNRQARALVAGNNAPAVTLGEYLDGHNFGAAFRHWYLLPMAASIWSCPPDQMLAFPLASFVRFCSNHGLLQLSGRPQWRTVRGGSRMYVAALLAGIPQRRLNCPVLAVRRPPQGMLELVTAHGVERFDQVVLACHSDQSLALLAEVSPDERAVLGAITYQTNRAVLHTDVSCLPVRRTAWSAWNYQGGQRDGAPQVCVHYLLNMLQPLPFTQSVLVSLNPLDEPDPACILQQFSYAHPVFDARAIAAQQQLPALQGRRGSWFAGAWTGYGFHEDGLKSGLAVADALIALAHQEQRDAA